MSNNASSGAARRSPRKQKGLGHERRAEIMAAARALFLSDGVSATSLRRIAARVGVSAPAIYVYFEDKNALLTALCDETFERLYARFHEIRDDPADPFGVLRQLLRIYCEFALQNPDEYRIAFLLPRAEVMHAPLRLDQPQPEDPDYHGALAFRLLEDELRRLNAAGHIVVENPRVLAQVLWSAAHGLVAGRIGFPEFPWADGEALLTSATELILAGLPRPARPA